MRGQEGEEVADGECGRYTVEEGGQRRGGEEIKGRVRREYHQ